MKNSDKKIIISLVVMLIASMIFSLNGLNKPIFQIVFWGIFIIFSVISFGFQKDRTMYKVDFIQVILIYTLGYLVFIYLGGLIFGFSRLPYSLEPFKILKNISYPLILILIQEILRFNYINDKKNDKIVLLLIVFVYTAIEIITDYRSYDLKSSLGIFEFAGDLFIPSLAKNALLTFLTVNCGLYPSLLYRIIVELYIFFVPIIPDYGIYINSILSIAFPTILYLKYNTFLSKKQYQAKKERHYIKNMVYFVVVSFLIVCMLLVSGIFKYTAIAIGSGSMYPNIKVGDAVVIEKLVGDELDKIQIGDVLVYKHESKIIVHRVTKIKKALDENIYRTKGDNNKIEDNYNIYESNVIGIVKYKISYIGYPSVWLSRKIS